MTALLTTEREIIGKKIAWIALISNIILTVGKIIIGIAGNSGSVFADGIHSAADIVASVAVIAVVGIANKPPDKDHPFGHGKAEVISEGIVGIILFLVSIYIIIEAALAFAGEPSRPEFIAMYAALFSFIAKSLLYRQSMNMGEKYNSRAIIAIAYDHKADIVASLAAFFGVLLAIAGRKFAIAPLLYADAAASIIVAVFIFRLAKKLIVSSVDILMEKNVDENIIEQYKTVLDRFGEVKRIDRIRARTHGHYILLDLRISLDHSLTIKQGHDIAHEIKNNIEERFPEVTEVFIHINPYFPEE